MKTLYKAKWILPGNGVVLENHALLVENGVILDVISPGGLNINDCEVVDFGNAVITSGFINLHTHLQYTNIREKKFKNIVNKLKRLVLYFKKFLIGVKPKSFVSWILDLMIEYICLTDREKQESFEQGLKQALLSGTTCIAQLSSEEMYFETLNNSPVKSYIFFEVFAASEETSDKYFELFRQKYERLKQKCSKSTFLGISPHSVYNVHSKLWEKISEYSRKNNVLIHTHFAESREEIQWIKTGVSEVNKIHEFAGVDQLKPTKTKLNPVSYLKNLNLPYKNLILAHINQLEPKDYPELAGLGTAVAHCPRSNMILHNRTLDVKAAIKAFQHRIGIGTDSLCSNYDLNILNEARFVSDAGVEPLTVLDMLTINPAKILRLDHIIGSIEKDKQADFLVFNLQENETCTDFINKQKPDSVYISGTCAGL